MARTGRNDACPCGSGRKFKRCCAGTSPEHRTGRMLVIVVGGLLVAALAAGVASFDSDRQNSTTGVWDPVHGHYH